MKKVFMVHGWGGSPNEPMLVWLKAEVEKKGFTVMAPAMPHPQEPTIKDWVAKLSEVVGAPDTGTFFIGHSVGCQTVLRYLETLPENTKVGGAVFIAPWMELDTQTIKQEGEEIRKIAQPWMETPISFEKVRQITDKSIAIFSTNDPYVPLAQAEIFKQKLGAEIIIENEKGHFDPASGTTKLPSALDAVLKMVSTQISQ